MATRGVLPQAATRGVLPHVATRGVVSQVATRGSKCATVLENNRLTSAHFLLPDCFASFSTLGIRTRCYQVSSISRQQGACCYHKSTTGSIHHHQHHHHHNFQSLVLGAANTRGGEMADRGGASRVTEALTEPLIEPSYPFSQESRTLFAVNQSAGTTTITTLGLTSTLHISHNNKHLTHNQFHSEKRKKRERQD